MVKDLRTNVETTAVSDVLDGDIDPFIEAYLRQENQLT
jgi:peptide chain release factor 2